MYQSAMTALSTVNNNLRLVGQGVSTTCASNMLRNFVPPYDATVVSRLKAQGKLSIFYWEVYSCVEMCIPNLCVTAGAQLIGKTNLDEFAMGTYNTTSFFGPSFNPWTTTNSVRRIFLVVGPRHVLVHVS